MGFFLRAVVAAAAALSLATPVHAESSLDVVDTPPPPATAPVPAYQALDTGASVLQPSLETAADIDAFLARTPLAGMGAEFIRAEAETGVNARFLVGITWVENNSGASYLAQTQHNLFSFVGPGPGGWAAYASSDESIQVSSAYIGKEYARPGGIHYRGGTIGDIGTVYASDGGWAAKVARAANFIGPSGGTPYAAAVGIVGTSPSGLSLQVTNEGFVPWDQAPGAQLVLHIRWARHAFGMADLPPGFQADPATVRPLLANHGPLLIVLDDVWDRRAVRPLLEARPPDATVRWHGSSRPSN